MFKLVFKKAEKPEIKLPTSTGSSKKQESSRKTSISALLTMPKPLTVWITINWKIMKEMGIPDHLTCLLRNLYAGQEATVRTGHETTDWFQIEKGVRKGCILSPCLFNFFFLIFLFFFFPFIFISWRPITLQYCSGFCHTLTWISHGFTCVPHPDPPSHLPPHPIPLGLPSAPALSTCLV